MMFEAVILDLDGVVTDAMDPHFTSWKRVFDRFFEQPASALGRRATSITQEDYFSYVDGVPRFDGVRRFPKARQIELPEGVDDEESFDTVHGLGPPLLSGPC